MKCAHLKFTTRIVNIHTLPDTVVENSSNMADNSTDVFLPLIYPQAGIFVLILTLLSLAGIVVSVIVLYIILKYDREINRQTSLLTKVYNIAEWVILSFLNLVAVDIIRFLTGVQMPKALCMAYVYQDAFAKDLLCIALIMEAVVHHAFLRTGLFLKLKYGIEFLGSCFEHLIF